MKHFIVFLDTAFVHVQHQYTCIDNNSNRFIKYPPFPSVLPSVTLFCPDAYLGSGLSDVIVFYRNMSLHMRMAHTRFGCTAPTGNTVMAPCYFQIYIVDREIFCLDAFLINGLTDFIVFYRNTSLHMRTAHTRFGCTEPTENETYGPFFLSNIHSTDKLSVRTHILTKWESRQLLARIWSTGYGTQVDP